MLMNLLEMFFNAGFGQNVMMMMRKKFVEVPEGKLYMCPFLFH